MALSKELQIGKAGEHIACADLILQGYNAFLADQGLPFDLVVADGSSLWRVQVKSCLRPSERSGDRSGRTAAYRFNVRTGRGHNRIEPGSIDVLAFVALDIKRVAYLPVSWITNEDTGEIFRFIEFYPQHAAGRSFSEYREFPL